MTHPTITKSSYPYVENLLAGLAESIIKQILCDIKQNGDYFQIDSHCSCVLYSRFFESGAYVNIFGYHLNSTTLEIRPKKAKLSIITDGFGPTLKFDIGNPNLYKNVSKAIKPVINIIQVDRDPLFGGRDARKKEGVIMTRICNCGGCRYKRRG
jgi:hypothetical protein